MRDELLVLRRKFYEAAAKGKVTLLTPLPRRVRLRLAVQRRIDHAACWLVEHCHPRAGEALWRICGMWH